MPEHSSPRAELDASGGTSTAEEIAALRAERDALARRLEALAGAEVRERAARIEADATRARAERAERHEDNLERRAAAAERAARELRLTLDATVAELRGSPAGPPSDDHDEYLRRRRTELAAAREDAIAQRVRIRRLEQAVSMAAVVLQDTRADIERAEMSRAWRIGHGVTRFMRRLTLRRSVTDGALVRAMQRIDRVPQLLPQVATSPREARSLASRSVGEAPTADPAERPRAATSVVREAPPAFRLRLGAPTWADALRGGDLPFARDVAAALARRGYHASIHAQAPADDAAPGDVRLVLRGRGRDQLSSEARNVLWLISHPGDVSPAECDGYDHVLVASEHHARVLADRCSVRVDVLEQATEPRRFFPDAGSGAPLHDVLYVANSRGVMRSSLRALVPSTPGLAVYGAGWERVVPTRMLKGTHIANEELASLYAAAKVVVCDHWDDMREGGFIANRVFDALACGAVVVSDPVRGLDDRLPEVVVAEEAELPAVVADLLADPDRRTELAMRGLARAHEETFEARTDVLLRCLGLPARISSSSA